MKNYFTGKTYQISLIEAIDYSLISSITDAEGVILSVNDKFCEVSKYSREELVGSNHRIINSNFHPKSFFENLWETIRAGNSWQGEIKNKAKDGQFYWVDTIIIPFSTESETRFLSLRMLINDRKELEAKKEDYTRSLESMLFYTSHNLRKPICSLMGLVNLDIEKMSINELNDWKKYIKQSMSEMDNTSRKLIEFLISLKEKNK